MVSLRKISLVAIAPFYLQTIGFHLHDVHAKIVKLQQICFDSAMPANTLIPEVSYLTIQFFALFKFATRVLVAALTAGCKTGLSVFVALVFSGIGKPKLKVYH